MIDQNLLVTREFKEAKEWGSKSEKDSHQLCNVRVSHESQ